MGNRPMWLASPVRYSLFAIRLWSGLGPLRDPGRTDDLPGFLLVPHVHRHLVAMLGQELAHPLLRRVLSFENLGCQRAFVPHPPFDLEAHETPPLFPPDRDFRPTVPLTHRAASFPFRKDRA